MTARTILVPTDFSPHADRALEMATTLAKEGGGEIHLLHAYDLSTISGLGETAIVQQSVFDRLREAAETELRAMAEKVAAHGIACKTHLVSGRPCASILEAAESLHVDLIVMGTRGATGLAHVFVGSTAERTVRLAHCPVMTVKARGSAER